MLYGLESTKTFLAHRLFSPWAGMALGDWLRLLSRHGHISPRYLPRAAFLSLMTTFSSFQRWRENRRYADQLREVEVPPPIFVLGHWRSGTTHLHHLLATDPRLTAPTMAEVVFPHAVLSGSAGTMFMKWFMPKTRGIDAIPLGTELPFEDEFAIAMMCGLSPYFGWAFPSHRAYHERALLLDDAADAARWKKAFSQFARTLAFKHGKSAIFKSPAHTARIHHLVDLFPTARFIHIHREPIAVFRSTRELITRGIHGLRLATPKEHDVEEEVICRYRVLYERFWQDRSLIPGERFIEISYAELDRQPIDVLRRIYEHLGLGDFASHETRVTEYVRSIGRFPKNEHPEIEDRWKRRLVEEWAPIYRRWNYTVDV